MRMAKGKRITEDDRREIERFAIYLRLVNQATAAGLTQLEAVGAVYPDAYPEDSSSGEEPPR
jgi:hypothetical protein